MKSNGEKICEQNDLIEYKMCACVRESENNERAQKKKRTTATCETRNKKLTLLAGVSYFVFIVLTFAYCNIVRKHHSLSFRFIPFIWIENAFFSLLALATRVSRIHFVSFASTEYLYLRLVRLSVSLACIRQSLEC